MHSGIIHQIEQQQCPISDLNIDMVTKLFRKYDVEYVFVTGNKVNLTRNNGGKYILGRYEKAHVPVRHMTLTFLEDLTDEYMANNSMYFSPDDECGAVKAFVDRVKSENPQYGVPSSAKKLEELYRIQSGVLLYDSHYEYLDAILEHFFKEMFNKTPEQMWCAGIVSAHGDKAYSYDNEWKKAGIPFQHGVLLFLLTYVSVNGQKVMGDTPKHESDQWVIDNYKKYLPMIEKAEAALRLEIQGKK